MTNFESCLLAYRHGGNFEIYNNVTEIIKMKFLHTYKLQCFTFRVCVFFMPMVFYTYGSRCRGPPCLHRTYDEDNKVDREN